MQKLFTIVFFSSLIISCKKENKDNKLIQIKEKNEIQNTSTDTILSEEENFESKENVISGFFFDKKKIDTLDIKTFSAKENKYLDSISSDKIEDQEKKIDYIFDNEIELHLTSKSKTPLKFEPALSFFFIKNIGDNNNDGLDEIALVPNYADESNLNSCKIYQHCNSQWQELFSFSINEMSFYFEDEKEGLKYENSIKDYFEKRNSKWYFFEYTETMDPENDKPIFKKLNLKKCK
jgi:hypothetical protein